MDYLDVAAKIAGKATDPEPPDRQAAAFNVDILVHNASPVIPLVKAERLSDDDWACRWTPR